jgi:hypothetical protein
MPRARSDLAIPPIASPVHSVCVDAQGKCRCWCEGSGRIRRYCNLDIDTRLYVPIMYDITSDDTVVAGAKHLWDVCTRGGSSSGGRAGVCEAGTGGPQVRIRAARGWLTSGYRPPRLHAQSCRRRGVSWSADGVLHVCLPDDRRPSLPLSRWRTTGAGPL